LFLSFLPTVEDAAGYQLLVDAILKTVVK